MFSFSPTVLVTDLFVFSAQENGNRPGTGAGGTADRGGAGGRQQHPARGADRDPLVAGAAGSDPGHTGGRVAADGHTGHVVEQHEDVPGQARRQGGRAVLRRAPHIGGQPEFGGDVVGLQARLVRREEREEGLGRGRAARLVGGGQRRVLAHTAQDQTAGDRTRVAKIVTIVNILIRLAGWW